MSTPAHAAAAEEPRHTPARYFWTTAEVALLREHYPSGGAAACLDVLPGRDEKGIYNKAMTLGLAREGRAPRRTYPHSPQIDAQIRKLYLNGDAQRGAVSDLARRIGRPRHYVTRRAVELGQVRPRFKPAEWCAEELRLLDEHRDLSNGALKARLRRAGFSRSETAIKAKRNRLDLHRTDDPDTYSARELADRMGIEMHKVLRWIARGVLKAKRRGTEHEIKRHAIRAFLTTHLSEWDHRRCAQLWLVDLLAGSLGGAE